MIYYYESYKKHFVARTGLGHDELARKCYKMPYKRDFVYFALFKLFLSEN
jgi:hypothetical protein